jgi:hypothetical protein
MKKHKMKFGTRMKLKKSCKNKKKCKVQKCKDWWHEKVVVIGAVTILSQRNQHEKR